MTIISLVIYIFLYQKWKLMDHTPNILLIQPVKTQKISVDIQYHISIKKLNIKPVFTKNKNDIETAYFKLKMNDANISTKFYSDNKCSKTINGLDIVTTYGELTPMIHVRSLYFGAHGSTEYNCSLQINLAQAIFKETQSNIPAMSIDSEEEEEQEQEEDNNLKKIIYIYKSHTLIS